MRKFFALVLSLFAFSVFAMFPNDSGGFDEDVGKQETIESYQITPDLDTVEITTVSEIGDYLIKDYQVTNQAVNPIFLSYVNDVGKMICEDDIITIKNFTTLFKRQKESVYQPYFRRTDHNC